MCLFKILKMVCSWRVQLESIGRGKLYWLLYSTILLINLSITAADSQLLVA